MTSVFSWQNSISLWPASLCTPRPNLPVTPGVQRPSESEVAQSCPTLCNPMDYSPPGSSIYGILQEEYWSGLPIPSPGDLPDPGIEPKSPTLQADALTSEPPGKPLETQQSLLFLWNHTLSFNSQEHCSVPIQFSPKAHCKLL